VWRWASVLLLCAVLPLMADSRPNFVIFQPDDMPFYFPEAPPGAVPYPSKLQLPAHDRLRQGGAIFSRAYTAAVTCAPSRFATLTGRYPSRGVWARQKTLAKNAGASRTEVTVPNSKLAGFDCENNVAATLKANGYRTGAFGKWHLWATTGPKASVWEDYPALQAAVRSCGFTVAEALYVDNIPATETRFSHNSEWIAAAAADFVHDAKSRAVPFFMYVNPTSPHSPSVVTALTTYNLSQTPAGQLAASPVAYGMNATDYRKQLVANGRALSSGATGNRRQIKTIVEQVAGSLWADGVLAAVLNALDANGVLNDTLVIAQMDHGVGERNTLKEGGARIHMAAHWPARIKVGTTVSGMVSTVDLQPTMLEAAGVKPPDATQIDGTSWLPLLSGAVAVPRVMFVEDILDRSVVSGCGKLIDLDANSQLLTLARFEDFRAVSINTQQQYDVCTDKHEKSSLVASPSLKNLMRCHDSETSPTKTASFGTCAASTLTIPSTTISSGTTTSSTNSLGAPDPSIPKISSTTISGTATASSMATASSCIGKALCLTLLVFSL